MQVFMYCEAEWKDGFKSLQQMGQTLLQIAASWISLCSCKMEVRCKENVPGCGAMLQASFLFSHLNNAVLKNRANVNKGQFTMRSSQHMSPEDTGSFQYGMPSEDISAECGATQECYHYENNQDYRAKDGKIMDFHSYINLFFLFCNFSKHY